MAVVVVASDVKREGVEGDAGAEARIEDVVRAVARMTRVARTGVRRPRGTDGREGAKAVDQLVGGDDRRRAAEPERLAAEAAEVDDRVGVPATANHSAVGLAAEDPAPRRQRRAVVVDEVLLVGIAEAGGVQVEPQQVVLIAGVEVGFVRQAYGADVQSAERRRAVGEGGQGRTEACGPDPGPATTGPSRRDPCR
jgi:hypothetical protein